MFLCSSCDSPKMFLYTRCCLRGRTWVFKYYFDQLHASKVVLWLRRLVASFSLQWLRFDPTPVDVGFVVNKVAPVLVYLLVFRLSRAELIYQCATLNSIFKTTFNSGTNRRSQETIGNRRPSRKKSTCTAAFEFQKAEFSMSSATEGPKCETAVCISWLW
jgi:hypothetical protein